MGPVNIWRRQWILTTLMILLALLGSYAAYSKLPRTYQAKATVVFLASHKYAQQYGAGNLYLSFNNSLSTTADVVSGEMTNSQVVLSLAERGFGEPYTVESESTSSQVVSSGTTLPGPFALVTVTGGNRGAVEQTLHGVTSEISTELAGLQSGMPASDRVSVTTLSLAPQASVDTSQVVRSLIVYVVALFVCALGLPLAVDATFSRKRTRHSSRTARTMPDANRGHAAYGRSQERSQEDPSERLAPPRSRTFN
jgi:hypothetical protein